MSAQDAKTLGYAIGLFAEATRRVMEENEAVSKALAAGNVTRAMREKGYVHPDIAREIGGPPRKGQIEAALYE